MTTMASQITSLMVVYSTVYSDADQRKHQSSASLAFVWKSHRDRWIPHTKGQLHGKYFHLMTSSWQSMDVLRTYALTSIVLNSASKWCMYRKKAVGFPCIIFHPQNRMVSFWRFTKTLISILYSYSLAEINTCGWSPYIDIHCCYIQLYDVAGKRLYWSTWQIIITNGSRYRFILS